MSSTGSVSGNVRPILAAIKTVPVPVRPEVPVPSVTQFITISREAGAGGRTLAQKLVDRLNQGEVGEHPWTAWDRELVEKVAADHHVAKQLVESLEDAGHSWMEEFLRGLAVSGDDTEARIYQGVATTMRALAQVGRVVLVGRGGVWITRNMPGGIHIRLVAPLAWRIQHMQELLKLNHEQAAAHVRQLERNRETFYRRYWPREILSPDTFTMTLNTAQITEAQMIDCICTLVPAARPGSP